MGESRTVYLRRDLAHCVRHRPGAWPSGCCQDCCQPSACLTAALIRDAASPCRARETAYERPRPCRVGRASACGVLLGLLLTGLAAGSAPQAAPGAAGGGSLLSQLRVDRMVWGVVPLLRMRSGQRPVNETQMNTGAARWLLVTIVMLVAGVGCSPSLRHRPPVGQRRPASRRSIMWRWRQRSRRRSPPARPRWTTFGPCWSVSTARPRSPTTGTASPRTTTGTCSR